MQPHHPILAAVAPMRRVDSNVWRSLKRYLVDRSLLPGVHQRMCTTEQRNNLYLLADQVLAFDIEGDFVELGCYEGQTASIIASVLKYQEAERSLHLYDHFQCDWRGTDTVRARLERLFRERHLPWPVIHNGDFRQTLPSGLPERIAFVHIDCGTGDLPDHHAAVMHHCLASIYPRMSPGAIGVLMDYHDPERTVDGWDSNPGVKMACDVFFRTKPECIHILYGNNYSHAFFRKVE